MPTQSAINLLYTKTERPVLASLEQHVQQISVWAVSIVAIVGLVIGGAYLFLLERTRVAQQTKERLTQQIAAQQTKEGLFLSIKERARIVARVATTQKPWAEVVDTVGTFLAPETIKSVDVNEENNTVSLSANFPSFESVFTMVASLRDLVTEGKVRRVDLSSFSFSKDGEIEVSLAFIAPF